MFDTIVKILITLLAAGVLIAILPISPFQSLVSEVGELPYLSYLNWFFPIGRILTVLSAWLVAIGAYYLVSWILRQLGIIGA